MSITVLLAAAAGTCVAAGIMEWLGAPRRARSKAPGRHGEAAGALSHVGGMTILLARFARRAGVRAAPGELEARIAAAGTPLGLAVGDVIALKGAAALGLGLFVWPFAGLLPGRLGIAALVAAPVAGYFAPELVLARMARARGRRIAGELADVLDLLRVAVGAGLPAGRAMGEVGRRMSGILAAELDGAAARMQLGAPRSDVLSSLVARCPASGVATLAAAIARADLHGASLAPALEALAAEARAEQARGLRDAAARAAPKIQLVVALVLVPAVMLLIGAVLVQSIDA
ncbi:MAG TPA: type II secretion system F family protein [Solirubrobacteraceae bacterium]|nr:type II secretion system F family protein [Solirubrobacteraceae bacterium]